MLVSPLERDHVFEDDIPAAGPLFSSDSIQSPAAPKFDHTAKFSGAKKSAASPPYNKYLPGPPEEAAVEESGHSCEEERPFSPTIGVRSNQTAREEAKSAARVFSQETVEQIEKRFRTVELSPGAEVHQKKAFLREVKAQCACMEQSDPIEIGTLDNYKQLLSRTGGSSKALRIAQPSAKC